MIAVKLVANDRVVCLSNVLPYPLAAAAYALIAVQTPFFQQGHNIAAAEAYLVKIPVLYTISFLKPFYDLSGGMKQEARGRNGNTLYM